MKVRINFAIVATLMAAGGLVSAESTPSTSLLVLSKGNLTLSIVDPSNLHVIAHMPSGPDPHEVIASSDGRFAYVSNYGSNNFITVVDLTEQKTLPAIDLGPLHSPHGLAYVGGKLWFTAEGAKVIGSYDPATKKVDWIMGTGQNRTHMLYVFDDLKRIITSNVASATMTFLDKGNAAVGRGPGPGRGNPQGDWDETVVAVGRGAEGFDVAPGGKELWAANAQDGTISIVDIASKKVTQTLAADVMGANRLKFTPDGKLVLVSTLNGPDVSVFDAATRNVVKRVKVGRGAAGIQMQPDGARAFIGCTPDDYVAIIDLKSLTVAGHIDAGRQPDGLAWAVRR
jgi:DNA-binding beta-propeller fold protein YncE